MQPQNFDRPPPAVRTSLSNNSISNASLESEKQESTTSDPHAPPESQPWSSARGPEGQTSGDSKSRPGR